MGSIASLLAICMGVKMKIKESVCMEIQEDNMMIFDSENNNFIEINETGKVILEMLGNNHDISINEIADQIKKEYECAIEQEQIFDDIREFITGMMEIGILI